MDLICPITKKECFGAICEFFNKDLEDCVIRITKRPCEVEEEKLNK